MAAAILQPDFPGFLPVGAHDDTPVTSDMNFIARIAEAANLKGFVNPCADVVKRALR